MGGNGSGGRNIKSSAIRKREGWRGHARARTEDVPGRGKLVAPPRMTPEKRELWQTIITLAPEGVLTGSDTLLMERLVDCWGRYIKLSELMAKGELVAGRDGMPVRNPAAISLNAVNRELTTLFDAIGMSPASRARLRAVAVHSEAEAIMEKYLLGNDEEDPADQWKVRRH
jgi:P27 family predicted phage terminase small subunit